MRIGGNCTRFQQIHPTDEFNRVRESLIREPEDVGANRLESPGAKRGVPSAPQLRLL